MKAPLDVVERLAQLQQSTHALRLYALVDGVQYRTWFGDQFMATRADAQDLPGRATVLERMQGAHDAATRIGFTSTAHIVHLTYLAADAPGTSWNR